MSSVFITGATSGIGRCAARLYARNGSAATRIVVTGRRKALLDEVCAEVEAAGTGARALGLHVDVADRTAMMDAAASLPEEFASTSILVNNAGLAAGVATVADGNIDDWDQMIDVNCKGLLYTTKAVLPGMIERGLGHVVNVGSVAGSYALPMGNVYCGTKAFVNHLTLAMRAELFGKGVRVTSVEPGNTETEFSVVRFKGDEEKAAAVYAGETERVAMTGDDIADVIYFCTNGIGQHVNINRVEMMPERQGLQGPFQFDRT